MHRVPSTGTLPLLNRPVHNREIERKQLQYEQYLGNVKPLIDSSTPRTYTMVKARKRKAEQMRLANKTGAKPAIVGVPPGKISATGSLLFVQSISRNAMPSVTDIDPLLFQRGPRRSSGTMPFSSIACWRSWHLSALTTKQSLHRHCDR